MTIRTSFVEHFGEENATKIEEAALMHMAEGPLPVPSVHAKDDWGPDPFRYLFLTCIARDCLTRWREWHGIKVEYEDLLAWSLEHADLHAHEGDLPDYMAALAGAYNPWINWAKAGDTEPEGTDIFRERNLEWAHMTQVEFDAEGVVTRERVKALMEEGMRLYKPPGTEGPL
jgi:hypothetical protein